jgi:hypothetical protein
MMCDTVRPRDLMREKGTPAAERGLLADGVTDDTILSPPG